MKKYYLTNCKNVSKLSSFVGYSSILNWISFSIEEIDFENLKLNISRFIEIDKDIAIFGFKSWGDPRTEIKVYATVAEEDNEFEDIDIFSYVKEEEKLTPLSKIKIPMTAKRTNAVVSAMKIIAKLCIEDEYDKRYKNIISKTSELERETWWHQLNDVDFLKDISIIKKINYDEFTSLVMTKHKKYTEEVKQLYIECQQLKQKFYNCVSIKELNILFEDYFNIPMHSEQALEIGREILNENSPNTRQSVTYGLNF